MDLLNENDAAAFLQTTAARVKLWAEACGLPCFVLPDGSRRFVRADIEAWLQAGPAAIGKLKEIGIKT